MLQVLLFLVMMYLMIFTLICRQTRQLCLSSPVFMINRFNFNVIS
nr:MAG TPA: hypothetical protein [Crassvirales sp.]